MTEPSRYVRILEEIKALKASRILEVGTWNGERAVKMIRAALEVSGKAIYFGFDLFEDMTSERSKEEFNVKPVFAEFEVERKLRTEFPPPANVSFKLTKGDTRRTLSKFLEAYAEGIVDFAWIDGGHSVETISSDWSVCQKLVRPGGVILLDDYYFDMPLSHTEKFGCNKLVKKLFESSSRYRPTIFPQRDPVKGGGTVSIVRVEIR